MIFFSPGATPLGPISQSTDKYHLLHLVVCEAMASTSIKSLRSDRRACLASNHYFVKCFLEVCSATPRLRHSKVKFSHAALKTKAIGDAFAKSFCEQVEAYPAPSSLQDRWSCTVATMKKAETYLPPRQRAPNRPWISE